MEIFNKISNYLDNYKYHIIGFCIVISLLSCTAVCYLMLNPRQVVVTSKPKTISKNEPVKMYVDIKGAVNRPGVYETLKEDRIIDVIKKASGLTKDANTSLINLSKSVSDQMVIVIYTNDEIKNKVNSNSGQVIETSCNCPSITNDACINPATSADLKASDESIKENETPINNQQNTLININNATATQLATLPGIGETKAADIINYRKMQPFITITDIKKVSGIGEATYAKIKDLISI